MMWNDGCPSYTDICDMLRKWFICCALLSVMVADGNAQLRNLPEGVVEWMSSPTMRHATVSIEVVDLTENRTLYAYDVERAVQPASLLKLVTTGAALRLLGGDYVIPDSVCCVDSTLAPIPELVGYNPDWMIEDVESSYCSALLQVPDSGMVLREYVKNTNEKSLNIQAEALAYLLTPERTLAAGKDTIKNYWGQCGLDTAALVMYDACGLAPADRLTAHFLTGLLREMKDDEDFCNSLPLASVSGTVIYFLRGTPLAGRALLKTGTTKSVVGYAGYVQGTDNHTYSVVLIVNNSTEQLTIQRKNIEKMFNLLIP